MLPGILVPNADGEVATALKVLPDPALDMRWELESSGEANASSMLAFCILVVFVLHLLSLEHVG